MRSFHLLVYTFVAALVVSGLPSSAEQPPTPAKSDAAEQSLNKAKQIVIACKLYELDHKGRFPAKLIQLLPDYLTSVLDLACPLSPKEPIGYDYFGGNSDFPRRITIQSKSLTPAGEQVVAYNDGDTELRPPKKQKPKSKLSKPK